MKDVLLAIEDLRVEFHIPGIPRAKRVVAVDGVSITVSAGEIVGLVGESGSGKSTVARAVTGLTPFQAGRILLAGQLLPSAGRCSRQVCGVVQMVFQDPFGSLNPRKTIRASLEEVLSLHQPAATAHARRRQAGLLLEQVGLRGDHLAHYPHEFSGGQRQRIGIARALAVRPQLLIADEPVSALDVSVQVQIMNLLRDLNRELGLAMLFIAHDLAVVRYMASRVVVMHRGRVVEAGDAVQVLRQPQQAYTRRLVEAVPDVHRSLLRRYGPAQG